MYSIYKWEGETSVVQNKVKSEIITMIITGSSYNFP